MDESTQKTTTKRRKPTAAEAAKRRDEDVATVLGDEGIEPSKYPAHDLANAIATLGVAVLAAMKLPTDAGDALYTTLHQIRRTLVSVHKSSDIRALRPPPTLDKERACALLTRIQFERELVSWALGVTKLDGGSYEAFNAPLKRILVSATKAAKLIESAVLPPKNNEELSELDSCLGSIKEEVEVLAWSFRAFFDDGNGITYESLNAGLVTICDLVDAVALEVGMQGETRRSVEWCLDYQPALPPPFADGRLLRARETSSEAA